MSQGLNRECVVLNVRFSGMFFATDSTVRVSLDGKLVGHGSVVSGINLNLHTAPGTHILQLDQFLRRKRYTLDLKEEGVYEVCLTYSRAWGNFASKADLRFLGSGSRVPEEAVAMIVNEDMSDATAVENANVVLAEVVEDAHVICTLGSGNRVPEEVATTMVKEGMVDAKVVEDAAEVVEADGRRTVIGCPHCGSTDPNIGTNRAAKAGRWLVGAALGALIGTLLGVGPFAGQAFTAAGASSAAAATGSLWKCRSCGYKWKQ